MRREIAVISGLVQHDGATSGQSPMGFKRFAIAPTAIVSSIPRWTPSRQEVRLYRFPGLPAGDFHKQAAKTGPLLSPAGEEVHELFRPVSRPLDSTVIPWRRRGRGSQT